LQGGNKKAKKTRKEGKGKGNNNSGLQKSGIGICEWQRGAEKLRVGGNREKNKNKRRKEKIKQRGSKG